MIISFLKLYGVWRWSGSLALDWEFGAGVKSLALGSAFYHALHLPNHEPSISYPTHSPMQPQVPIPIQDWNGYRMVSGLGCKFFAGSKFGAGIEVWRWDGSLALSWSLALE